MGQDFSVTITAFGYVILHGTVRMLPLRCGSGMVSFVDNDCLELLGVEFGQSLFANQSLVCCNGALCQVCTRYLPKSEGLTHRRNLRPDVCLAQFPQRGQGQGAAAGQLSGVLARQY